MCLGASVGQRPLQSEGHWRCQILETFSQLQHHLCVSQAVLTSSSGRTPVFLHGWRFEAFWGLPRHHEQVTAQSSVLKRGQKREKISMQRKKTLLHEAFKTSLGRVLFRPSVKFVVSTVRCGYGPDRLPLQNFVFYTSILPIFSRSTRNT